MSSRLHIMDLYQRNVVPLLPPDRAGRRLMLYQIAGSVIIAFLLLNTGGDIFASFAFIGMVVVLVLSFYRLDWGLYIFVATVLAFDQFTPGEFFGSATIIGVEYFQNLKSLPILKNVAFAVVTPMELHLFLLLAIWLLLIMFRKDVFLNRVPVAPAGILFFLWVIFSFANGMRRGGDFLIALWEVRALFYLAIMFLFVPQVIQKKSQVKMLIWVCIPAIAFKALIGIIRFVSVGFTLEGYEVMTNHEDPLFFISLLVLMLGSYFFGGNEKQRKVLLWLTGPLIAGFIVAQRRAAFGALVVSMAAMVILLPRRQQMMFVKAIAPVAVVFCLYLAVFWKSDSTSMIAKPAIFIRSAFYTSQKEAAESYSSNLFREMENYDLAYTVRREPVLGIGFGNKYFQPIMLPQIPFPLKDYIPHNAILWLIVKTGAIGMFLFCLFMTSYVFRAASVFSRLNDPYLKTICIISIAGVLGQIVVSYFDLQLTFYRNMIYLGMLMGLLPVLEFADTEKESDEPAPVPAAAHPYSQHF